jgi:hypothetical protein
MNNPEKIQIELTRREAIVLFEYLRRSDDAEEYAFVDQAEQRVMWDLECILEKQLTEIFAPDYREQLDAAREAVRDPTD